MAVDKELTSSIVGKLGQLWEDDELSDIKLIIDDFQFNCHKFHLSACSEFFRVLLKTQTVKTSNDVIAVHISGITPETFNRILSAVYKGELTATTDNMADLWHASHHLQVDFLVKKVEDFIVKNIADDNFFNIYAMAIELGSGKVKNSVQNYMAENFNKLRKTEDLLNLSFNCLQVIIFHDGLILESRDDLVIFVLKWIDYKPKYHDKNALKVKENDKKVQETKHKLSFTESKKATNDANVIFKPRDEVTYKVESSSQRKDNLGELMKIVKLNEVSHECLLMLLNNDDVMECREARTIVRQVFADLKDKSLMAREIQITKRSSTLLLDGLLVDQRFDFSEAQRDTVDVVVYLQNSFKAILAYVLDTKKTYSLSRNGLPQDGTMKDVYSHKNQLYILIGQSVGGRDVSSIYKLQQNAKWEYFTEVPGGSHSLMFKDNYMYCVFQFQLAILNMEATDILVWICVYDIQNTATHFVMCGHKVLILHQLITEKKVKNKNDGELYSEDSSYSYSNINSEFESESRTYGQSGYHVDPRGYRNNQSLGCKKKPKETKKKISTTFAYLDVETWEYGDVQGCKCTTEVAFTEVKSFAAKEKMFAASNMTDDVTFLLTKEGLLLRVTNTTANSISVTSEDNFYFQKYQQMFYGAIRQENVLYLLVPRWAGLNVPQLQKLISFVEVKVCQLLKMDSNLVPVSLPHQWLTDEIHI